MDEKEYLLMRSVHAKIDDVITEQHKLNSGQIWVARQPDGDDIIEEEDEESGVFCMSNVNVFQKTDPTVSLSYWIGQLLSQKMLAGKGSYQRLFTPLFNNFSTQGIIEILHPKGSSMKNVTLIFIILTPPHCHPFITQALILLSQNH